jgi:iron complex transport system permease protein
MTNGLTLKRWMAVNLSLFLGLMVVGFFALMQGTEEISVMDAIRIVGHIGTVDSTQSAILLQVRLPRILLAGLVGGILALCGCVFQAMLRNPLADPFILGVSSGAALGVYLAMLFGLQATVLGIITMPVMAMIGGILAVGLVYQIAKVNGRLPITGLLLSGVVVNAILSAFILFLTSVLDAGQVMNILMWIMGHITAYDYATVAILSVYSLIGGAVLLALAKPLNLLTLGEEQAISLGLGVEKTKKVLLLLTTFLTGVAVSISGIIGFVGMIAPHTVRMVIGPDHRLLLPASALVGGAFLIAADTASRSLLSSGEIPVGVLTALCGGPLFLFLLKARKSYWI